MFCLSVFGGIGQKALSIRTLHSDKFQLHSCSLEVINAESSCGKCYVEQTCVIKIKSDQASYFPFCRQIKETD